ncbi:succinate dehydrogenase, hydrophobic membrane anchor protein [Saccharospirillum sp. HFRX-1]|uniref:succinate dehydrogenase, hydrophobic membrane anchor protein n=1 Tax=unclassified Saccharospirillum TaxID=2633430 RepID=UPI0037159381
MVRSITNLSRSGLADWMIQRISAVLLATYTLFVLGVFIANPDLGYAEWRNLFSQFWVKIYTLITLLALVGHIWVGMWTVATDYLKNAWVRFIVLFVIAVTAFVYLVAGVSAVWGV